MPKAHTTWKVLPHRPIEKLDDRVWRIEGDLEGMPLKRVMTVARRGDGGLVIHNAMALEDGAMNEIETWGRPAVLVVPNGYHRLDARVFKDRYPELRVLCPRGARAKVSEVVPVDGGYEDLPPDDHVSLVTLDGTKDAEGAMIVRGASGATLVLNDTLFNMPHQAGFSGFVLRHLTRSSGGPAISRVTRWFIVKDGKAFAAHLTKLADTKDLVRIVVSHHETISEAPAEILRRLAATM